MYRRLADTSHSFNCQDFSGRRSSRYAVVIFLPPELDSIVAPLRERFDPDYGVISSHVTIVFPFESTKSLDDVSLIVREEIDRIRSLEIELSSIGDFYPSFPVICWRVKDNVTLTTVHRRLYARLDLPLPHKQYSPHVTVAREISHHRVMLVKEKIVSYLPDEKFRVRAVDLVSPVADHNWVSVRTFPLAEG